MNILNRLLRHAGALCMLAGAAGAAASQPRPAAVPDTIAQRAVACAACHGKEGRATSEGFVPRIAGKPAGYLYNQLLNFRDGQRQHPAMTHMVAHLSDSYLRELSVYFAAQHPPYPAPNSANATPAMLARGRTLALSGDRGRNIPACVACHGQNLAGVLPATPGLLGLPRDYLNAQFGAWKTGARKAAAPDCMAQVSRRLAAEDIAAVAAWLSSQPAPPGMAPALAHLARLPLECGSAQ
ncbi:MAG: c-type cytochrome [Telluria sp.]